LLESFGGLLGLLDRLAILANALFLDKFLGHLVVIAGAAALSLTHQEWLGHLHRVCLDLLSHLGVLLEDAPLPGNFAGHSLVGTLVADGIISGFWLADAWLFSLHYRAGLLAFD
jgi:hypothetical protein